MASWMGAGGREAVLDLIRQRLDDQTLDDPTPRILRRFLEEKLDLREFELDDDGVKQQIKEMINEVLQEEDEQDLPPKKSAAKSSTARSREPRESKASMPKSSPLYTHLRKLCQAASLNPNKLVNSSMYLPEKVSALKKALIDAGFKSEQLKSDTILETIEVAEASKFAKENSVDGSAGPRSRRRAAAAVDYKAIFAKETAGIEGIDSEAESEEEEEEEEPGSEEEDGFSMNESADEEASESSEEESVVEDEPPKRASRNNSRGGGRGRGRRKQISSDEDEDEEDEDEPEEEEEEEEDEVSDEQSEESAPKKKKSKKNYN